MKFRLKLKFIKKIPNILTSLRVFLVPIICLLMWFNTPLTRFFAVFFALVACISDYFDGDIARKYHATTKFGKCMDPIADKTLVMALLFMLVYTAKANVFASIIILFREFVVSGVREYVAHKGITIHVSKMAKYKTTIQMVSLLFLMVASGDNAIYFGNVLLSIAAGLSAITGAQYLYAVRKEIFD